MYEMCHPVFVSKLCSITEALPPTPPPPPLWWGERGREEERAA